MYISYILAVNYGFYDGTWPSKMLKLSEDSIKILEISDFDFNIFIDILKYYDFDIANINVSEAQLERFTNVLNVLCTGKLTKCAIKTQ